MFHYALFQLDVEFILMNSNCSATCILLDQVEVTWIPAFRRRTASSSNRIIAVLW